MEGGRTPHRSSFLSGQIERAEQSQLPTVSHSTDLLEDIEMIFLKRAALPAATTVTKHCESATRPSNNDTEILPVIAGPVIRF